MADTSAAGCGHLLDAVAEAGGTYPASAAHVAGALAARGARELAARFLDRVVPQMSDDAVEALAMFLGAGRQDTLAVYVLANAAVARGTAAVIGYLDMLRRHADPVAADELIRMVVATRPELTADLLAALRSERRPADADHVLELLVDAGAQPCGAVLLALWNAGTDHDAGYLADALARYPLTEVALSLTVPGKAAFSKLALLGARLSGRRPAELADALVALRSEGYDPAAYVLTVALLAAGPETVCAVAIELARSGLSQEAGTLLELFTRQAAPPQVMAAVRWLDDVDHESVRFVLWTVLAARSDGTAVLRVLRDNRHTAASVERALADLVRTLPVSHLAAVAAKMSGLQIGEDDAILTAAVRPDCLALCEALHAAGNHRLAYRLAERRAEFTV